MRRKALKKSFFQRLTTHPREIFFTPKITSRLSSIPHAPILGSSNSAANKDMVSKILTNRIGIQFSNWVENIDGKEEIARFFSFPTMFSKAACCCCVKMSI